MSTLDALQIYNRSMLRLLSPPVISADDALILLCDGLLAEFEPIEQKWQSCICDDRPVMCPHHRRQLWETAARLKT